VVKKHSKILESLADWLERESDAFLRRHAVLVIDDEADQAGLDVGTGAELEGVHKQLRRVVNLQTSDGKRRCAYLAYTATPYANILTAQDEFGLYPRDFIYPLDKPPGYVGSEEFFGDAQIGNPVLLETDESEDLLTAGLKDAVRWFVVATAARAALQGPVESFHSSMLIHTTQSTEEQKAYRPVIEEFLVDLRNEFELDESTMRDFYLKKLDLVPARQGGGDGRLNELTAPWGAVRLHVRAVLWRLIERVTSGEPFKEDGREQLAHSGVIVDNSKEEWKDRLTYSDIASGEPSVTVIAVGGNTLSRGLTLEGLVCSYFARTARTYDSLMQMGRWFGYRPGYRHLLRVWTTRELFNWFAELNQVEVELREELLWMQAKGMTPDRYGPRIRVSPNLNITRAAAMRSVCKEISYSDTLIDPAWLDLDADVIATNQQLARLLAGGLDGPAEDVGPSKLFRSVPHDRVRRFLAGFRFHAEEKRVDVDSLLRYLDNHEAKFPVWSVLFKSLARGGSDEFDYGGNVGIVSPVVRARQATASVAYIGSLVDSGDHRLDAGGAPPEGEARFRASPEPPLMVVYAIDRVSSPARKGRTDNGKLPRAPLNAPSSPISVSMALPKTSVPDYVMPAIRVVDNSRAELDLWDHDVV
jgi:hypothetical protein